MQTSLLNSLKKKKKKKKLTKMNLKIYILACWKFLISV